GLLSQAAHAALRAASRLLPNKKGPPGFPAALRFTKGRSELHARAELEHARLGQQLRILTELRLVRSTQIELVADVEPHRVEDVEAFRPECQSHLVVLIAQDVEPLRQPCINAEVTVAADAVALSRFAYSGKAIGLKG